MSALSRQSPWRGHLVQVDPARKHWLTDVGSLTLKLKSHSQHFAVIPTFQGPSSARRSLCAAHMHARTGGALITRDVILTCDGHPVVFGHTTTPMFHIKKHWPFFHNLGSKALGLTLFFDPLIKREAFEFTSLKPTDALYQKVQLSLVAHGFGHIALPQRLLARRGVFRHMRHPKSWMLVTEIMLPQVYDLKPLTI